MKKTIAIFLVLVVTVLSMTYVVSAVTLRVDFSKAYVTNKSPMTLRYNPENLLFFARACTDLSVASDHEGFAEVLIKGNNAKQKAKRVVDKSGNMYTTGVVELDGAAYATYVQHKGYRHSNASGVIENFLYDVYQK